MDTFEKSKYKKIALALVVCVLVVITYTLFGMWSGAVNTSGAPQRGGAPMGKALTKEEKAVCGITASVTEGPYYVSGMGEAVSNNINFTNLPGKAISVLGYVYDGLDNSKPISNASVEIWHTDASGAYWPNGNGAKSKYSENELALRAFVKTDANGKYTFSSIYPGEYSGRTTHIHVKIRAEGYSELTSQLILPASDGHDEISFDEDTVSQGLPSCHLLSFAKASGTDALTSVFDFRLAK